MQKVRLWEVTSDSELQEVPGNEINLEERLEGWLASDISVTCPPRHGNTDYVTRTSRKKYGSTLTNWEEMLRPREETPPIRGLLFDPLTSGPVPVGRMWRARM